MTYVAGTTPPSEADLAEETALALSVEDRAHGIPDPEEGFEGPLVRPMGSGEFAAFVEEVAIRVSIALTMVGLDGTYEAVHGPTERCDLGCNDFIPPGAEETERAISFRTEDGADLPVYVSCGSDGVILVCVARGDEGEEGSEILFLHPPRTLAESDLLVGDVIEAIEREVPRPTFH